MEKKKIIKELSNTISVLGLESVLDYPAEVVAEYLYKHLEILSWFNTAKARHNCNALSRLWTDANICIPEEAFAIKEEQNEVAAFVDKMYSLYPTKCPKRNTSLGKSRKDKVKIKRLLKTYSQEEIERVIRHEVDSNYGINYMKNFSTFLNNFPDPNETFANSETSTTNTSDKVIFNGVEYK